MYTWEESHLSLCFSVSRQHTHPQVLGDTMYSVAEHAPGGLLWSLLLGWHALEDAAVSPSRAVYAAHP